MEAPPADVSDIIRRRRSRTLQEEKVEITFEDLQACFHLPLAEVARLFGVGTTFMKKRCRIHGIKRWPFRKIRSEAGRRQNDTSPIQQQYEDSSTFSQLRTAVGMHTQVARSAQPSLSGAENNPFDPAGRSAHSTADGKQLDKSPSVEDVACGVLAALCCMAPDPPVKAPSQAPSQEQQQQQQPPPPPQPHPRKKQSSTGKITFVEEQQQSQSQPQPQHFRVPPQSCHTPKDMAMPYTLQESAAANHRPAHPYSLQPLMSRCQTPGSGWVRQGTTTVRRIVPIV